MKGRKNDDADKKIESPLVDKAGKRKPSVDLNSQIDYQFDLESHEWLDPKLTQREKLFVYYYCATNGANLAECARLAGYKDKNSAVLGCRKKIELGKEIENFRKKLMKVNVSDAYNQIIRIQRNAALFDPIEFYEEGEVRIAKDYTEKRNMVKDLGEISPENRLLIKGVKADGSIELIDREKAMLFIKKLHDEMNGEGRQEEYSTELTIEQIKDKVTASVKIIKKHDEEAKAAGKYYDEPENLLEEA